MGKVQDRREIKKMKEELLLATQHSLRQRGQALALLRPSVAVQQALATFGLAGHWADPSQ